MSQVASELPYSEPFLSPDGNAQHGRVPSLRHFGFTIFLSAFLLFWVELLLGKYILPWFGGTPAVWTTCMFFFQISLLGGYIYAHVLSSRFEQRSQGAIHFILMAASVILLGYLAFLWSSPITPGASWKPQNGNQPIWHIVALLSISVGLPYFILSSTGPLLQAWFGRAHPGNSPYRLYALSNLGSFLGLLSYPFVLEPSLSLKTQARVWSWGYLCFAIVCGSCALLLRRTSVNKAAFSSQEAGEPSGRRTGRPGAKIYALWLSLSACASVIFLATTNQICQDIGVVPFLWVLPLSLYLLTFIICFEKEQWYSRRWFHPAFGIAIFMASFVLYDGALGSILAQIAIYSVVLFIFCMVCHGELVRSKPHSRYLTSFYLTVSAGGALGGVLVSLLAPNLFKGFREYQLGLWACAFLVLLIVVCDKDSWLYRSRLGSPILLVAAASLLPAFVSIATGQHDKTRAVLPAVVAVILVLYVLANGKRTGNDKARRKAAPVYAAAAWLLMGTVLLGSIARQERTAGTYSRNFYGVLGVFPQSINDPNQAAYSLRHGRIVHGFQFRSEARRRLPTSYFGPMSGIGRALLENPRRTADHGLRIGIIGLGIGTIAAYGQPGDYIRFYEINPEIIRIARDENYFTYLKDSRARVEVIPGDARLSMEAELDRGESQNFDVLALDAFSGDAIPVHLLTEQAFEIYLKHLRTPDAMIAVHVTNTYLDLRPAVSRIAKHFGLKSAWISSAGDGEIVSSSEWVLLSRTELPNSGSRTPDKAEIPETRLWTDDYSNLFQVLKR